MADSISKAPPPLPLTSTATSSHEPASPVVVVPDVAASLRQNDDDRARDEASERRASERLQARQQSSATLHAELASEAAAAQQGAAVLRDEVSALSTPTPGELFEAAGGADPEAVLAALASAPLAEGEVAQAAQAVVAAVGLAAPAQLAAAFAAPDAAALQLYAVTADAQLGVAAPSDARDGAAASAVAVAVPFDPAELGTAAQQGGWPALLSLGLARLVAQSAAPAAAATPYALALWALTGRPVTQLTAAAPPAALFAALSQANAPLQLPVLLRAAPPGRSQATYVATGTFLGADGAPMVRLVDSARLGQGLAAASETWPLAELAANLHVVLLPDGRPGSPPAGRHRTVVASAGRSACCLTQASRTASAGQAFAGGVGPAAAAALGPQAELIGDRCLTCVVAQQACVPQAG